MTGYIYSSLRDLSGTIDDFRTYFARSREKSEFNVKKEIANAYSFLKIPLTAEMVNVNLPEDSDITCYGYPSDFRQVIVNILNNSREAINSCKAVDDNCDGFIDIRVFQEDENVCVLVKDNGCGIPEDILDRVFEPYFTTKFQSQGKGTGLFMSKIIIEKNMNGTLEAQNTESGAVIKITLPAHSSNSSQDSAEQDEKEEA